MITSKWIIIFLMKLTVTLWNIRLEYIVERWKDWNIGYHGIEIIWNWGLNWQGISQPSISIRCSWAFRDGAVASTCGRALPHSRYFSVPLENASRFSRHSRYFIIPPSRHVVRWPSRAHTRLPITINAQRDPARSDRLPKTVKYFRDSHNLSP